METKKRKKNMFFFSIGGMVKKGKEGNGKVHALDACVHLDVDAGSFTMSHFFFQKSLRRTT